MIHRYSYIKLRDEDENTQIKLAAKKDNNSIAKTDNNVGKKNNGKKVEVIAVRTFIDGRGNRPGNGLGAMIGGPRDGSGAMFGSRLGGMLCGAGDDFPDDQVGPAEPLVVYLNKKQNVKTNK